MRRNKLIGGTVAACAALAACGVIFRPGDMSLREYLARGGRPAATQLVSGQSGRQVSAPGITHLWSRQIGGQNALDTLTGTALRFDSNGSLWALLNLTQVTSNLDVGGKLVAPARVGDTTALLAVKYNEDGDAETTVPLDFPCGKVGADAQFAVDRRGQIIVAGHNDTLVCFAMFARDGKLVWSRTISSSTKQPFVSVTSAGAVWLAGEHGGTIQLDGFPRNAPANGTFLAKYSSDGVLVSGNVLPDTFNLHAFVSDGAEGLVMLRGNVQLTEQQPPVIPVISAPMIYGSDGGMDASPGRSPAARADGGSSRDTGVVVAMNVDASVPETAVTLPTPEMSLVAAPPARVELRVAASIWKVASDGQMSRLSELPFASGYEPQATVRLHLDRRGNLFVLDSFNAGSLPQGTRDQLPVLTGDIRTMVLSKFDAVGTRVWSQALSRLETAVDVASGRADDIAVVLSGTPQISGSGECVGTSSEILVLGGDGTLKKLHEIQRDRCDSHRLEDVSVKPLQLLGDGLGSVALATTFAGHIDFGGGPLFTTRGRPLSASVEPSPTQGSNPLLESVHPMAAKSQQITRPDAGLRYGDAVVISRFGL